MWIFHLSRELKDLRDELGTLQAQEAAAEESASYEIVASASHFSRGARAVVDDKLSFSATLMRAGEVDAANRLLAEVETEVREKEAALIERVNEVQVARVMRKERLTRLRLIRTLALAIFGSSVLTFSAVGVSLAGLFEDAQSGAVVAKDSTQRGRGRNDVAMSHRRKAGDRHTKQVRVGNMKIAMTAQERQEFMALTSGTVDSVGLAAFLSEMLPPQVASQVTRVIAAAKEAAPDIDAVALPEVDAKAPDKAKKKAKAEAKKQAEEAEEKPADDATQEPDPEQSPDDGESEDNNPDDEGEEDREEDGSGLPLGDPGA